MKNSTKIVQTYLLTFVMLCIMGSAAGRVSAGILAFDYDIVFSGDTPGGSPPYLTAVFDDTAAAAGYDVRLTMSAMNLVVGVESVEHWYFNLNPTLDSTLLSFNAVDVVDSNPENDKGQNGIYTGNNAFQANGDGTYDILFDFPPPQGQFDKKFTAGESVIYDIGYTGAETLSASSFNFFSESGGGQGSFLAASHIQDTPGSEGSSWVGVVPEPVSSVLFVIGGGILGLRIYRKKSWL